MPVAANLLRVTRPAATVGGSYLAMRLAGTTLHASIYQAGDEVSYIGSVALPSFSSATDHYLRASANRIHVDSEALVADGAVACAYRQASTTWRLAVWDVEGSIALATKTYTSTNAISAPVYDDGWLWFLHIAFPTLSLRRIRADLSGEEIVGSLTVASVTRYTDDANLIYLVLTGVEAVGWWDEPGNVDTPRLPRDGSPGTLAPGIALGLPGAIGLPLPDGRGVAVQIFSRLMAVSPLAAGGGAEFLWPSGWDAEIGEWSSSVVVGVSLDPAGTAISAYPMQHVDETGAPLPRVLVRTAVATTYGDADPVPYFVVHPSPTHGGDIGIMLARN